MKSREYLKLAVPFTISTITQPLLGAVDTAVIGRLPDPSYIGGVAIGTVIFSTMYWLFGFLRVSTSGFSAQALGSRDEGQSLLALLRPALIALMIGITFLFMQNPIKNIAMEILKPDAGVQVHTLTYFNILIWSAPAVLLNYVFLGWLMGRRLVKASLFLQVFTNLLNIILDLIFVLYLKMEVAGVAYATLIAQLFSFVIGLYLVGKRIDRSLIKGISKEIFAKKVFKKIMAVNSDLMIRTICLLTVTNMFVAKGAAFGTDILAANAILFQVQYIMAYFFDGFANASSVLTGSAVGEKNRKEYKAILSISNKYTFGLQAMMAAVFYIFKSQILGAFTTLDTVIALGEEYHMWIVIFPFTIGIGLVYYGIFTGASYTKPIRNSMLISLLLFLTAYFVIIPSYDNHGLWLSFILFSLGRSIVLALYMRDFEELVFIEKTNEAG